MLRLKNLGVDFGSRRWGGWFEGSDYDRLVMEQEFQEVCAYLNVVPARDHQYDIHGALGNSYHVYLVEDGKEYNFLVYRDIKNYNMALEATSQIDIICRTAVGESMRNTKRIRHIIVQETFKATRALLEVKSGIGNLYGDNEDSLSTFPQPLEGYPLKQRKREERPGRGTRFGGMRATAAPTFADYGRSPFLEADAAVPRAVDMGEVVGHFEMDEEAEDGAEFELPEAEDDAADFQLLDPEVPDEPEPDEMIRPTARVFGF